jgi:hypothetical protein
MQTLVAIPLQCRYVVEMASGRVNSELEGARKEALAGFLDVRPRNIAGRSEYIPLRAGTKPWTCENQHKGIILCAVT